MVSVAASGVMPVAFVNGNGDNMNSSIGDSVGFADNNEVVDSITDPANKVDAVNLSDGEIVVVAEGVASRAASPLTKDPSQGPLDGKALLSMEVDVIPSSIVESVEAPVADVPPSQDVPVNISSCSVPLSNKTGKKENSGAGPSSLSPCTIKSKKSKKSNKSNKSNDSPNDKKETKKGPGVQKRWLSPVVEPPPPKLPGSRKHQAPLSLEFLRKAMGALSLLIHLIQMMTCVDLFFSLCFVMACFCLTLNCNGLRDEGKRKGLLQWLLPLNPSFLCLQETHAVSNKELSSWFSPFGGLLVASHHTRLSAGVAVFASRRLAMTVLQKFRNIMGRFACVELHLRGICFRDYSVYALIGSSQRNAFLEGILPLFDPLATNVIADDFDSVPDLSRNRFGGDPSESRKLDCWSSAPCAFLYLG